MVDLLTYPSYLRIALILMGVGTLLLQALFLQQASPLREFRDKKRFLWEISLILLVVVAIMCLYLPHYLLQISLVISTDYEITRYVIGLVCSVQALYWRHHSYAAWPAMGAAVAILPVFDMAMPYHIIFVFCCIVVRVGLLYPQVRRDLHNSITAYSIQEAIDTLQTGVMLARMDGEVVLVNAAMLDLIEPLLHKPCHNAQALWEYLDSFVDTEEVTKETYDAKLLFHFSSGKSYMFSKELLVGNYGQEQQITCTDVTDLDHLNRELMVKNALIESRTDDLRHILRNIDGIQRDKVYAEVTSRVHDIMGQRITIFQQLLKNKRFTDYESILPLLDGVMEDIRRDFRQSPEIVLENLLAAYENLGITIAVRGELPHNDLYASTFVSVLREAFTNAVLHGNANRIDVIFTEGETCKLTIKDNGLGCKDLQKGQGLRGMEEKIADLGGTLQFKTQQGFTICIEVGGAA